MQAPLSALVMHHLRNPATVLVAGCLISLIGFGARSSFGLYFEPMTVARSWDFETFALALAIQNLLWGLCLPLAAGIADRYGTPYIIGGGALIYALGIWGMANSEQALMLHLTAGLLTGVGVAFTAFSLALSAMSRVVGRSHRSLALGLGTACGSLGQVVFSPLSQALIERLGWHSALLYVALLTLLMLPLAFLLPRSTAVKGEATSNQSITGALSEAFTHRGYLLLSLGFFVCGFHVAFIAVHFPNFVTHAGFDSRVGAYALALIGLCNIVGSLGSGVVGQYYSKKNSLAWIYALRTLTIMVFMLVPLCTTSIYVFAALMGFLWLSTVPLTTAIVAQVFGVRYMATLCGFVFLSHQLGSFSGVWLGGYLFEHYGSYDGMWWAGIGFGAFAAMVHLLINERPLPRLCTAAQPVS